MQEAQARGVKSIMGLLLHCKGRSRVHNILPYSGKAVTMSVQASLTCACHTAGAKGLRAAKLVAEAILCVLKNSEDNNTPLQVCSISAPIPPLGCLPRQPCHEGPSDEA